MAEVEEQGSVAEWNAHGINKNHHNCECLGLEESRRLAVDGKVGVMKPNIVGL